MLKQKISDTCILQKMVSDGVQPEAEEANLQISQNSMIIDIKTEI